MARAKKENQNPEVMRIDEVAAFFGMSRNKIYKMLKTDPNFPKKRNMGSHFSFWKRSECEEYLKAI